MPSGRSEVQADRFHREVIPMPTVGVYRCHPYPVAAATVAEDELRLHVVDDGARVVQEATAAHEIPARARWGIRAAHTPRSDGARIHERGRLHGRSAVSQALGIHGGHGGGGAIIEGLPPPL